MRAKAKKVNKFFLGLLSVFFLVGCSPVIEKKTSWFVVKKSSVNGVGEESYTYGDEASILKPHRIDAGKSVVVAFRQFISASDADSASFIKATIAIPEAQFTEGAAIVVPSEGVTFSYVKGGSAWPRAACFSKIAKGTIKLNSITNISVSLDVNVELEKSGLWPHRCIPETLHWSGNAEYKSVDSLSSFEGRQGTGIYSETYDK